MTKAELIKELDVRHKLIRWLAVKMFNTQECEILPKPLRILNMILFPALMCNNTRDFRYDFQYDCFVIYGVRVSGQFFKVLKSSEIGKRFEIIERDIDNGETIILLRNIPTKKIFEMSEMEFDFN